VGRLPTTGGREPGRGGRGAGGGGRGRRALVEPTYEAWYGVPTMPRLDLSHPEARRYFLDVAVHWLTEHGVDGWRMDVARYVDPGFWRTSAGPASRPGPTATCWPRSWATPPLAAGGPFRRHQ